MSVKAGSVEKFTWKQVKEHASPEDAWVTYHNKVYDVSNWHEHPAGGVIITHAGDDMTDIFAAFHAPESQNMMKKFFIGDLIPESVTHKDHHQLDFEKGYRELRSKLIMFSMFKSSEMLYAYKCVSNMTLWTSSMAVPYYSDSVLIHIGLAMLM
jgi:predicted heme/steroid binding protein